MFKLPQKPGKWLENFIRWGGLAYIVYYCVNGEPHKALIFAVAFGLLVILYENHSDKFRD